MDAYIREIAKAYGVPWSSDPSETSEKVRPVLRLQSATHHYKQTDPIDGVAQEDQKDSETGKKGEEGGKGPELPSAPVVGKEGKEDDFDVLAKRFAELKKR